jgi:hypothetical protein
MHSLQGLDDGEYLANSVHLFPAGRDPMTELKEQTIRP